MSTGRMPRDLSSPEQALTYVRETVLADPAVEGTFLSENDLAEQIGVSRNPVREALLLLVAQGVATLVSGRGAYVTPLSGREMRELKQVRGVLERFAATTAINDHTVPIDHLRATMQEQAQIAETSSDGDLDTAILFIERHIHFHQTLIDAVGNDVLTQTYAGLRVRQRRVGVAALFRSTHRLQAVCDEQAVIVEALARGDEGFAHTAIDNHLQHTLLVLLGAEP